MLQESCAQPGVSILRLGGGLCSCRRIQRYCYVYFFRRTQDPAPSLHYCFLTLPPSSLITVPICPLKLREGHGSWSLFSRNRGHRKSSEPRSSTGFYSVSIACPKIWSWPCCEPRKSSGSSHRWHDCWKD